MILFPASATTFTTYGLGVLEDAISCIVTKQGMLYELRMEYPISGKRYEDIEERCIIYAKPDQVDGAQPFRIYRITKPLNGRVTVYARHISYDMTGIPVSNFTASSASDFASKIKSNALTSCPFTFTTNISKSRELVVETPDAMRSLLGGGDNTWQKVYGGELKFNGYTVSLLSAAGVERPLAIRYGVDIVNASMEHNIEEVYTGVLPFYSDDETKVIGDVQNASGSFSYSRIKPLDLTRYFDETPTKAQVNSMAQEWLADNDIQIPEINIELSYAQINQVLQQYDTVTVQIPRIGVSKKVKVTKTEYDVLRGRYESVEVGDPRPRLSGDLFDAARLKKGTLPVERIADHSIGGSKYGRGSVPAEAIADGAVTVNKIHNGAVNSVKIEDGAVTGIKVLDKAIELAKLSNDLQVFYADTIAAMNIVAEHFIGTTLQIDAVSARNLTASNALTVGTGVYKGGSKNVHMSYSDSYSLISLTETQHTGYDSHGATYTYYTYDLNVDNRTAQRGTDATIDGILVQQ